MAIATGSRLNSRRWFFKAVVVALGMAFVVVAHDPARAGALDDIRARGVLVVGTKGDYRPFGFRDDAGIVVGFEPDLAAEVAKALGVKLKLVPVVAANRIAMLQSGDLDLVIATMNVTPERAKQVDFVEPSYYASGVNVLAPKSAHLHVWQELRDKPVCTVEGAYYVAEIKERYGPDLHLYKDTSQVYAAVKSGECFAAYDDTALIGQLQTPGWEDYEMPLRSVLLQPWGMAVKQGNTELAQFVGDLVKKWHAGGHIEELEKTWHIPPSVFAEEMHRRFADTE
ncbi:MAG TPA: transporter substrate-binding domain-containing protein [Stellaceae bacterium]|nr:transporter substrate-binding domain-containing protein [Stellaceae bacterium]